MIRVFLTAFALTTLPAIGQHGHDEGHEKKAEATGEIRVYIADEAKNTVDPKDLTVTLLVEPKGGAKKTLKADLVTPKGGKKAGIGHGGEVRETSGYHVEFVVVKPHEAHEAGHGKEGHEEPQGHEEADGTPYFRAATSLTGYACGMEGHPVFDQPGRCTAAGCSMVLKPVSLPFKAAVIFKVKGETKNVKGFEYPPALAGGYKEALVKIEEHLGAIDKLIQTNDLDKVHGVAEKISEICERLPGLASKDGKAAVEKTSREIVALFKEIDEAADSGKKEATIAVFNKYKAKVAELKKTN